MPRGATQTWLRRLVAVAAIVLALMAVSTGPSSAHVVPWTTVLLDIEDGHITADVEIPMDDLAAATGINLPDQTQAQVDAHTKQITAYLQSHFQPTSDTGATWSISVGTLVVVQAGDTSSTGLYRQLSTVFTLTPPAGSSERSFDLGYSAIVDKVATHVVVVTVSSDWAAGRVDGAYELGTIQRDTVSDTVLPFRIDLDDGSSAQGLWSMILLGVRHIQGGTDHQLFLLALLIPAPLMARNGRWRRIVSTRVAVRRICRITLAFTVGHSITLALGTLGLAVPQQPIEAAIAVSIVVAAAHAFRPLFPGREALVAASFGLVHGLAFSQTLRQLHLSGARLVLSLFGFNLGIEAMQIMVVALVLPALIVVARTRCYKPVRVVAAITAAAAATGWLLDRVGHPNPIASAADRIGQFWLPVLAALWLAAFVSRVRSIDQCRQTAKRALVTPVTS